MMTRAVFAPARVNMIGEHTDYFGGLVLPVAVDLGMTVTGRLDEGLIRLRSLAFSESVELGCDGTPRSCSTNARGLPWTSKSPRRNSTGLSISLTRTVRSRMTGDGFDDSIMALAEADRAPSPVSALTTRYAASVDREATGYICASVDGAGDASVED